MMNKPSAGYALMILFLVIGYFCFKGLYIALSIAIVVAFITFCIWFIGSIINLLKRSKVARIILLLLVVIKLISIIHF